MEKAFLLLVDRRGLTVSELSVAQEDGDGSASSKGGMCNTEEEK